MRRFRILVAVLALLASGTAAGQAGVVTVFKQLGTAAGRPAGIATDFDGNVFVSLDVFGSTMLRAYDPNGMQRNQLPFQNLSVGAAGHMAIERASGRIANLQADGAVVLVDGSSGDVTRVFSFRELATNVSAVFDIQTDAFRNATNVIRPESAQYGDIAVLTRDFVVDVFATGYSSGFAFVTHVRFGGSEPPSPRVLVSSSGPAFAGSPINFPRGVAVNHAGIVATSLPIFDRVRNVTVDRAVAFGVDFAEGAGFPPIIALGGIDLPSRGMAADLQGNFYVTSGLFSSSLCGQSGHGLVRILVATGATECFTIAGDNVDADDVTVSPAGDVAYVVLRSDDAILRVQLR